MYRPLCLVWLALLAAPPFTAAQERPENEPRDLQPREAEPAERPDRELTPRIRPDTTLLASGPRLGLVVTPVGEQLSGHLQMEPGGLFVVEVVDGSPAAQAGIRRGDIVLSADGRPVDSPSDLANRVRGSERATVELEIQTAREPDGEAPAAAADDRDWRRAATRRTVRLEIGRPMRGEGGDRGDRRPERDGERDDRPDRGDEDPLAELLRDQIGEIADRLGDALNDDEMRQLRRLGDRLMDRLPRRDAATTERDADPRDAEERGEPREETPGDRFGRRPFDRRGEFDRRGGFDRRGEFDRRGGFDRRREFERRGGFDRPGPLEGRGEADRRRFQFDRFRQRGEEAAPESDAELREAVEQLQRELRRMREEMRRMQREPDLQRDSDENGVPGRPGAQPDSPA